jgi:hypothetical protein
MSEILPPITRRRWLEGSLGACEFARLGSAGSAALSGPPEVGELPFRHIHLDFHTSPAITGVGADFRAGEFAAILKEAAVNSITVFAKCHHGMSYYPTQVGVRHPNLKIDLLGEMIEACHRNGIRTPVYISTMLDQYQWTHHADWRVVGADGSEEGLRGNTTPLNPDLGKLCVNTPYADYLAAQAEEVLKNYEVDGLFYDNFWYNSACYGPSCMLERERLGLDSADKKDCKRHVQMVKARVMERLAGLVRAERPKARVYINSVLGLRQDVPWTRSILKNYTHIEIESLPGGSWGYSSYEMTARYLRNFGLDTMGMTGGFHRSWGDFGTVRNQAALDYECFRMLAQANKCAIGDHLHPSGQLNRQMYERIGLAYRSVREKEPWCAGAKAVTEIGVLLQPLANRGSDSDLGAANILMQLRHQFDMLDRDDDFRRYAVLILPDAHRLDAELAAKLRAFLESGGKLLLSHESGLDEAGRDFVLPAGLDYQGPWKHEAQYLEPLGEFQRGIPPMVHTAYDVGSAVKARPGTAVLARVWEAYFDKDFRHFQVEQTPFSRPTGAVGAAAAGNIVYFAIPLFRSYARFAYPVHRQLVANAIDRLLPRPMVRAEIPSTAQVTVTAQPGRLVVHVLHYIPQRRAPNVDIVEDVIPLHNVKLALRTARRPRQAYLAPQRLALRCDRKEGYAQVIVPVVTGHQMIVFET